MIRFQKTAHKTKKRRLIILYVRKIKVGIKRIYLISTKLHKM